MVRLLIGLVITLFCVSSFAVKPSDARFSTNIYVSPYSYLKHQAELGDAESQYSLAWMYYGMEGERHVAEVPQSYQLALRWYRKAALQGHQAAQYNLAIMYIRGEGVSQNYIKAYAWAKLAAEAGHESSLELATDLIAELKPGQVNKANEIAERLQQEMRV